MPSFQHFQNQAEQKSRKPKFATEALSLSGLLQYAESAKKQSFDALCRLQPLVKTYHDKIEETFQAMGQAESTFEPEAELPGDYATALASVKASFEEHLRALAQWMNVLSQKKESQSEKAMTDVKQSGQQLETSLKGLSIPA